MIEVELNYPNAVSHDKDFYGRHAERWNIERSLRSGTGRPVIILGERRIGKTSLQQVTALALAAKSEAPGSGPRFVPIFMPTHRAISSLHEFAYAILYGLCGRTGQNVRAAGLHDSAGRFHFPSNQEFTDALARLLADSADTVYLICIDEFDAMLENCRQANPADTGALVALVDHVIAQWPRLPLLVSLTMADMPDYIASSYGSPFIPKGDIVQLQAMPRSEMIEMLDGLLAGRVELEPAVVQRLFYLTDGQPYFVKLLLSHLLARHRTAATPLHVRLAMLDEIVDAAVRDRGAGSALQNVYEMHFSPAERSLALLLAERQAEREQGLIEDERIGAEELRQILGPAFQAAARSLAARGYLRFDRDTGCELRLKLLGAWLQRWEKYEVEFQDLSLPEIKAKLGAEVRIDEARKEVRVRGELKTMGPQELQVLLYLAHQMPQVVSRDALAEELYPEAVGAVTDGQIDQTMRRLRVALGDTNRPWRYVVTVAGGGFRLEKAVVIAKA